MANKADLVETLVEKCDLSKKDAGNAVQAIIDDIRGKLLAGEEVRISNLGTFSVKDRAARKGRNPQTGEEIEIAPAKVPAFKPSPSLKEELNK